MEKARNRGFDFDRGGEQLGLVFGWRPCRMPNQLQADSLQHRLSSGLIPPLS